MQGYGQVNMKGKLTRRLGCKCCTAFNFTKLNKYSKVQEQREISEGVNEWYSDDALELLAYAYHTGENYTDRDDLEMKYYEHLDCGNERWGFLP